MSLFLIFFLLKINMFDFEEFDPKKLSTWIDLINFIPRFPIIFIIDCITVCFLIRLKLKISVPLISFTFTLLLSTMSDNLTSFGNNRKPAVFEHPFLIPIFSIIWFLFNYFPFDLIFKIFKLFFSILSLLIGFLSGRDVCHGIDVGINLFPSSTFSAFLFGIFFSFLKFYIIFIFSKIIKQKFENIFVILFEIILNGSLYYWFTDLGHISYTLWFDKEEMRLVVLIFSSILAFLRHFIKESFYNYFGNLISKFFSYFIPYYGKTWIPTNKNLIKKD